MLTQILVLLALTASAQTEYPRGSYEQSCRSCIFDGQYLHCECRTSRGTWPRLRPLDWRLCETISDWQVSNHEGLLVCAYR